MDEREWHELLARQQKRMASKHASRGSRVKAAVKTASSPDLDYGLQRFALRSQPTKP